MYRIIYDKKTLEIHDGVIVLDFQHAPYEYDVKLDLKHKYNRFNNMEESYYTLSTMGGFIERAYRCDFIWADSAFWHSVTATLFGRKCFYGFGRNSNIKFEKTITFDVTKGLLPLDNLRMLIEKDLTGFFAKQFNNLLKVSAFYIARGLIDVEISTTTEEYEVSVLFNGGFD